MSLNRTDSEIIAAFVADFDSAMLDDRHIRQCGRALADTMAVAIAARGEPAVHRAWRYIDSLAPRLIDGRGTNLPTTASLWGWQQASTIEGAALFNGIAAHVLDFDDASSPMSGHPSVALLPALVALAEARGTSGIRLISAYIVGFEICCKLGRALNVTHYARGWHMTATVGAIAAAASCGHLLGLDREQIVHAIGLATAQTGGTRENFGTDAKPFQAGQSNAAAIRATLLAEQGFTASSHSLDGKAGYTTRSIRRRRHLAGSRNLGHAATGDRSQRHRSQKISCLLWHPSAARRALRHHGGALLRAYRYRRNRSRYELRCACAAASPSAAERHGRQIQHGILNRRGHRGSRYLAIKLHG